MIKIRTIIFGIVGLLIMILGIYNIFEHSSFWLSMGFVIVGGAIILISLFFEPTEEAKDGKQGNVSEINQAINE